MDRELLAGYLKQGLSLTEIGALMNRDPSTVGYWVQKHGLTANGKAKYAPRGGLAREQLVPLVERRATLHEMARELDRSVSTIRHWLAKYGLEVAHNHGNRALALACLEAGQSRFSSVCRYHGETEFLVFRGGRYRCAKCNNEAVIRRRRSVKRTLVEEAGGRCARCGFDEHPSALQFHHLDPSEKEFAISQKGVTIAIERSRAEASKCLLLCANCHALVEAGVAIVS